MFLCCGDSLFDMFVAAADEGPAKITINGIAGGSPMNVAVGLARMSHASAYLTQLSSDVFGEKLKAFLADNKVDTSLCPPTDLGTSLAFVNKQADGSADYSFYIENTADSSFEQAQLPEQLADSIRVVHFGSYSTAIGSTADTLAALARREQDTRIISYDPNLRLAIEPDLDLWRERFIMFAQCANIIKASDEDIEGLFGKDNEDKFAAACFEHGAQIVFVTRGASGASVYSPDGTVHTLASEKIEVVDTVGAGDTFQAALLHRLVADNHIGNEQHLSGDIDTKSILEFALHAAAVTCTRFGADLPTLDDL